MSRCYERTIYRWISHRLVEISATYGSFLSCADTKSSWIPRVRFIRFNEDICVPLRCPLPASIDEQKGSKQLWMLITSNFGDARIKKRPILSLHPLSAQRENTDDRVEFVLSSSCCLGYRCFRENTARSSQMFADSVYKKWVEKERGRNKIFFFFGSRFG